MGVKVDGYVRASLSADERGVLREVGFCTQPDALASQVATLIGAAHYSASSGDGNLAERRRDMAETLYAELVSNIEERDAIKLILEHDSIPQEIADLRRAYGLLEQGDPDIVQSVLDAIHRALYDRLGGRITSDLIDSIPF